MDKYGLGVKEWLMSGNNAYSLISMSGTMLSSIHEGYWDASDATKMDIANTWAQATIKNGVACCDCSCGNIAMMEWAVQYVNPDILAQLLPKLYDATKNPLFLNNTQSTVPPESQTNDNQKEASTQNPTEGSTSSSTVKSNSTSTNNNVAQNGDNQGDAISNVGEGSEAAEVGSSSSEGADVKKSIEINPITSQSASEVGLSIVAVLAILCLIMVVAVGYFRDNNDIDKTQDLDKLFKEKF